MTSERASQYTALADDVQAFRHYIQSERGLASNTLLAYGRDLERFAGWVRLLSVSCVNGSCNDDHYNQYRQHPDHDIPPRLAKPLP